MISIEQTIPHRPPFLFLDEILSLETEEVVARRVVRESEPHFAGHYPGNPIMPGVLLCEAVFQAAAVLLVHRLRQSGGEEPEGTPILARIQEAKFKRMVRPGEELRITASFTETLSRFHFLRGKVTVDGKPVLTLEFALALIAETSA